MINEELNYGINKFETYQKFADKVYKIRENVIKNISKLKKMEKNNRIWSTCKSNTSQTFFGISHQIDFIVEDNKLKHKKFIPGVKIPIYSKTKIKDKNNSMIVLAWNFFDDIKKNNAELSNNFINIKSLEKDN